MESLEIPTTYTQPTHEEFAASLKGLSDAIRGQLEELGDDGTTPREVRHQLKPSCGKSIPNWISICRICDASGFKVLISDARDNIIAIKHSEVASSRFDQFVGKMCAMAHEYDWEYLGWEARALDPNELQ